MKTILVPSAEYAGQSSRPSDSVIRRRLVPSLRIAKMCAWLSVPGLFLDEDDASRPSGDQSGCSWFCCDVVTRCTFEPSASIT